MGCALLDLLTLSGGRRLRRLTEGPGAGYPHLIHVGVGWAFARLRLRPWHGLRAGDPMLRWLAWDGFGFHQGFFASDRVVGGQAVEAVGPARRAIRDQGLGRSLWFHECADPEALALRVALFPEPRRADLWSGIGLAATYAGGAAEDELRGLVDFAAPYAAHLAQGAVFGAAARMRAAVPLPPHCGEAVRVLAGVDARTAAGWADAALEELGPSAANVAEYEAWRAGIRRRWAEHGGQREQQERLGWWEQPEQREWLGWREQQETRERREKQETREQPGRQKRQEKRGQREQRGQPDQQLDQRERWEKQERQEQRQEQWEESGRREQREKRGQQEQQEQRERRGGIDFRRSA